MHAAAKRKMSIDEYLELDNGAEVKHEFVDGEAWAMSGGTIRHAHISGNLYSAFRARLAGTGSDCRAFNPDVRIHVARLDRFFYPDLSVACGVMETRENDGRSLQNPSLIAEVLSPSTEDYDRGSKWQSYQQISTLNDYVVVAQDKAHVSHFERTGVNRWSLVEYHGLAEVLELPNLNLKIPLSEIYADIEAIPEPAA